LKSNGLYTKHALGQNFLVDREVLEKIIETAEIKPDDLVIEVGPGVGTLTVELVKQAGKVVAVEMDDILAQLMSKSEFLMSNEISNDINSKLEIDELGFRHFIRNLTLGFRHSVLEVVNADILKLNISELTKNHPAYKVVANIPYYITSKILQLFLTLENKPESITVLVQKEVAERICAKSGQMSVLAISVQAYGEPEIIQVVKKESFFPAPKVDSAILRIAKMHPFGFTVTNSPLQRGGDRGGENKIQTLNVTPPPTPPQRGGECSEDDRPALEKDFFRAVHIGFASKRKTLANNLSAGYHIDKTTASAIIKSIGLSENVRAQELSLEDWAKLTKMITLN
jgi:16S rRNA (adenine1518-N6/adenine1519-N6)-dimethyltransferase